MGLKKIAIVLIVLTLGAVMAFTAVLPSLRQGSGPSSEDIENFNPIVVLELFTSQGCSSCPPADALLDTAKSENPNTVFALSYHVDYWNYIGWEDPFSTAKHTERQRDYNIKLQSNSNYTPELIVNGKEHFVGSDASKVYSAIRKYAKIKAANQVSIQNVEADERNVSFDFGIFGGLKNKSLRAILVLDERKTQVKRGENRNRSLTNSNVVVAEKSISVQRIGKRSFIAIPEIVEPHENISIILLLQNETLDITGAAKAVVKR